MSFGTLRRRVHRAALLSLAAIVSTVVSAGNASAAGADCVAPVIEHRASGGTPSLSAQGRYLAFASANSLVTEDTNGVFDVFVHDSVTGITTRVSVASDGTQATGESRDPSISADGRFVAFGSEASNLVADDTNGVGDVFVHDRGDRTTTRVSLSTSGAQRSVLSWQPALSGNGRFVVFHSTGDFNSGGSDVLVHDRELRQTSFVGGASAVHSPGISADGRFIVFHSDLALLPDDTNGRDDAYLRDRQTGALTRVSVANDGTQSPAGGFAPAISADGRFVSFTSGSETLVPQDTNQSLDVFVRDRVNGQTTRVSLNSDGSQLDGPHVDSALSGDGRYVAFVSRTLSFQGAPLTDGARTHILLHDRATGTTVVASPVSRGGGFNFNPTMSADGRFTAFDSDGANQRGPAGTYVHRTGAAPAAAWEPGTAYLPGALVDRDGITYEALVAHRSQVGWEPPSTPSLWVRPTPCEVTAWAPQTAYVVGSRVTHGETTYAARQAHTSQATWTPPNTPSLWRAQ